MLLEAAIGDAYGAVFEYCEPSKGRLNDLLGYHGNTRHNVGHGRYTDDTEMTTAVAEAMLEGPLTEASLAKWFVSAFQREQRVGYSRNFFAFLKTVKDADDFLSRIDAKSDKSGAAMRGWIIGLYDDPEMVMSMARLQAKLTHDTPAGIMAAQAAAMAFHYICYRDRPPHKIPCFLGIYLPEIDWSRSFSGPVGSKGLDSVQAAITALMHNTSLSLLLRDCVNFGGDVDTVATIALGVASCSSYYRNDLPQCLIDGLEAGPWGKDYLADLDNRLLAKFAKSACVSRRKGCA